MPDTIKIDLGCGRRKADGFIGIDKVQIVDGKGVSIVDVVMDVSKDPLPYEDGTVDEILADSVLEHVDNFLFVINECYRVLKPGGILRGTVPVCGSKSHWKDPTHQRCFIEETFSYFTGNVDWAEAHPSRPKYAEYGIKPWNLVEELRRTNNGEIIAFKMTPQK